MTRHYNDDYDAEPWQNNVNLEAHNRAMDDQMSKLAHSNQETMDQIARDAENDRPDEPEQRNNVGGRSPEIVFQRSKETSGYPDPLIHDLNDLSDRELASYIAASGNEYDGMGPTLREAIVRLLRRAPMAF